MFQMRVNWQFHWIHYKHEMLPPLIFSLFLLALQSFIWPNGYTFQTFLDTLWLLELFFWRARSVEKSKMETFRFAPNLYIASKYKINERDTLFIYSRLLRDDAFLSANLTKVSSCFWGKNYSPSAFTFFLKTTYLQPKQFIIVKRL